VPEFEETFEEIKSDEQDASSPAPAGERPEALEGQCQSLVREAVKEDRPRRRATGRRPLRGDVNRWCVRR
jgi:hypothetical protein